MSDIYEDLKARAAEHNVIPAFKFIRDRPGAVVTAFISLNEERDRPEFARLTIQESADPAEAQQYLIHVERLEALLGALRQPPL
jgi:hypothetical protein